MAGNAWRGTRTHGTPPVSFSKTMSDIASFIERIIADPTNDFGYEVLADYLEGHGDSRSVWIRWWTRAAKPLVIEAIGRSYEPMPEATINWTGHRYQHVAASIALDLCWRHFRYFHSGNTVMDFVGDKINRAHIMAPLGMTGIVSESEIDDQLKTMRDIPNTSFVASFALPVLAHLFAASYVLGIPTVGVLRDLTTSAILQVGLMYIPWYESANRRVAKICATIDAVIRALPPAEVFDRESADADLSDEFRRLCFAPTLVVNPRIFIAPTSE